jgi:hypothetical protein
MKKKSAPPTPPPTTPTVATISIEQLAGLANLTKRRLNQLADDNKIPQPTNGIFPMLATITALFSFYQRDGEEIQREKLKKLTAERKITEQELDVTTGDLINRATAEIDAIGIVQRLHNACTDEHEREIPAFVGELLREHNAPVEMQAGINSKLVQKVQSITARRVERFQQATEQYLNTIPAGV